VIVLAASSTSTTARHEEVTLPRLTPHLNEAQVGFVLKWRDSRVAKKIVREQQLRGSTTARMSSR